MRRTHGVPLLVRCNEVLVDLHEGGLRSYIPEPERGPRNWDGKEKEQKQVYGSR
jgi:hypothetical protein